MKNKGILQNKPIKKINIFPFLINRLPTFLLCIIIIIIIYYRPVSIKRGTFVVSASFLTEDLSILPYYFTEKVSILFLKLFQI